MIFVTIGSMLPFDRLIMAMDRWASHNEEAPVLAQIGEGRYQPRHMQWSRLMPLAEYAEAVAMCSVVVAHAGMGSIISAAEAAKPIVIMPRRQSGKEATTDHQVHTVNRLAGRRGIFAAMSEVDLPRQIHQAMLAPPAACLPKNAPDAFISRIREFLCSQ